jgi:hypothetical protein
MPTITVRVNAPEKADIERRAALAGMDMSAFIRRALDLERDAPDLQAQLDSLGARVKRLEGVAGL